MNNNVVLKRICIFFLGLGIGLVAGHKHGVAEMKERFHNRVMKKAEKSVLPRYEKQPEPFEKGLFDKREKREQLRERLEKKETPKVRVPR